jgi:hypothetical protein
MGQSDEWVRRRIGGPVAGTPADTGLEWSGNESTTFERMLLWSSPFAIYDATYMFKVYPRKKTTGSNPRYYTTFFWGNNGTFTWDSGAANTYYGGHPFPVTAPLGPGQWEISTNSNDYTTGVEVVWDRWFTQVFRAWRESATLTHHEFIWDYDDWLANGTSILTRTNNDVGWADTNPPAPAIFVGQGPNVGGVSWGGYAGFEEYKGIIRGMQFYDALLTMGNVASELASPGSVRSPWYLNVNPKPTDITDKSGNGHHPSWIGADRPALWTA